MIPAVARAQEDSSAIDDVRGARHLHLGPLYFGPLFLLKELGVDSNVFNDPATPRTDFTLTVTPKTTVWMPVARRALLTTIVSTDLVWYAKYATERSNNPEASVRAETYLRRLTLFAEGSYLNSRQRNSFDVDARVRHVDQAIAGGVRVRMTPRFSIDVGATSGRVTYVDGAEFKGQDLHQALNHTSEGASLAIRHRLTPLTAVVVKMNASRDRFPAAAFKDTDSVSVMPGVEFKPRALISGSAYVGVRRFTPKSADVPGYTGPVARLSLSYTMFGATSFGASWIRDLGYSYDAREPYYVGNSVGASIRQAMGSHFDVLLSSDRHQYAYRRLLPQSGVSETPVALPLPDGSASDTWNHTASLGYRVGHLGRIGAGVSYWRRRSTSAAVGNFDNLRMQVMVTP
ncbi:MAG: hypothetical protein DMF86_18730 [Acidobacteria bacterium]|nr:MAG: hypothetical protein DMF86_18730 [Acidobacteriota bacterium]